MITTLAYKYHPNRFIRAICALVISVPLAGTCSGQSVALSLASVSTAPGGTVTVPISLAATGGQPAALQWTLNYAASDVASVTAAAGPVATAAGKDIQCRTLTASTICVLSGINSNTIANGTVATLAVQVAASRLSGTVPIGVTGSVSASLAGQSIPSTATGGTVAITPQSVPITLQSLSCAPSSVVAPGNASCSVSLSQAAPATGSAIALTSSNAQLKVPALVTIASGASSATFAAVAATAVTANTDVQITASWNGGLANAMVKLTPPTAGPAQLSAVACAPAALTPGGSATCTATLKAAAQSSTTVALTSNSAQLTVPGSITIASGASTGTFTAKAGNFTADSSARVSATLNSASVNTTVQLNTLAALSSVGCAQTSIANNATTTCTVTLTKAATANVAVALSSSGAALKVPASVSVATGATTAQFTATAAASGTGTITVTATALGISKTVQVAVTVPALGISRVECPTTAVIGGTTAQCKVTLTKAAPAGGSVVTLTSNTATVTVPATTKIAAGATSIQFAATVAINAVPATTKMTATLGTSQASANLTVDKLKLVLLTCSPNPLTPGSLLVCKADLNAAPSVAVTVLNASSAPTVIKVAASAVVPAKTSSARFVSYSQAGSPSQTVRVSSSYGGVTLTNDIAIAGKKTSSISQSSKKLSDVAAEGESEPEVPVIDSVVNGATLATAGACSPGAAAVLIGHRLVAGDAESVRVDVNGEPAPVMIASPTQVTFQCPDLQPGTPLAIAVHTDGHSSKSIHTEMEELSPGIFTIDGVERARGAVTLEDTADLVVKAPDVEGKASRPGETISILCTGLGRTFGSGDGEVSTLPTITIGGMSAPVQSVTKVETGVYQVNVRIPEAVAAGDAVPLEIQMPAINGRMVSGNRVHISVERSSAVE